MASGTASIAFCNSTLAWVSSHSCFETCSPTSGGRAPPRELSGARACPARDRSPRPGSRAHRARDLLPGPDQHRIGGGRRRRARRDDGMADHDECIRRIDARFLEVQPAGGPVVGLPEVPGGRQPAGRGDVAALQEAGRLIEQQPDPPWILGLLKTLPQAGVVSCFGSSSGGGGRLRLGQPAAPTTKTTDERTSQDQRRLGEFPSR